MPDLTLAEIVAEGERLEHERVTAAQMRDYSAQVATEGTMIDFYQRHGPALLAAAKAALRVQADLDDAPDSPITMEAANALSVSVRPAKGGHDA